MSLGIRVANILGKPFGINPFPRAFANGAVSGGDAATVFDEIYRESAWDSAESVSGPGSERARTAPYARRLRALLDRLGVHSVLDAPCGDLNWILPVVEGRDYIGADVAPALVADLRQRHPGLDLRTLDICSDPLPQADIWHCRDCLFHLPLADIERALRNFARSQIPYALLTTHRAHFLHRNLDIPIGGWRYLDLERPPVSLPRPSGELRDFRIGLDFPRYVGLWTREQVAARFG